MPIYEFVDDQGRYVDRYFAYEDVPGIGQSFKDEGVTYTRVIRPPSVVVERDHHFVAWSQEPCQPNGEPKPGEPRAPSYDMDPKSPGYLQPRFSGKAEIRRFCNDKTRLSDGQEKMTYGEV